MTHSTSTSTASTYGPDLGKSIGATAVSPGEGPRRPALRRVRDWFAAFVFTVPALALFGMLVLLPMGYAFYVSFFNWGGFGSPTDSVGFDNYTRLFQDPVFLGDLWRGVLLVAFSLVLQLPFALAMPCCSTRDCAAGPSTGCCSSRRTSCPRSSPACCSA